MTLGRAQHNFKQDSRGIRIEANMFTNAQGLQLLEPRSSWTCLPAVHVSEKWSQHNFKQDAGWFKTSDQGEYVYQSHKYRTYTQTLDMFANSARVWKMIPAQHSSFQVSMSSTLTLSSCARKAATNKYACAYYVLFRVLHFAWCSPILSWPRIMFFKCVCCDFLTVAINTVNLNVLSLLVDNKSVLIQK